MTKTAESGSAIQRIRDAEDALEKAQQALDKARPGLSAVEAVAEKAETVRRHPVRTGGAVVLLIASIVTLIVAALQDSDD